MNSSMEVAEKRARRLRSAVQGCVLVQAHVRIKGCPKEMLMIQVYETDSVTTVIERIIARRPETSEWPTVDLTLRGTDGLGNIDPEGAPFSKDAPLRHQIVFPYMVCLCCDPVRVKQRRTEQHEKERLERSQAQDKLNMKRIAAIEEAEQRRISSTASDMERCTAYEKQRTSCLLQRQKDAFNKEAIKQKKQVRWMVAREENRKAQLREHERECKESMSRVESFSREQSRLYNEESISRMLLVGDEEAELATHNEWLLTKTDADRAAARKKSTVINMVKDIYRRIELDNETRQRKLSAREERRTKAQATARSFTMKYNHILESSRRPSLHSLPSNVAVAGS